MKYRFGCIYCKHLKSDYSLLTRADVSKLNGYYISEMDEGVYYVICKKDDFGIECAVDTTTIKPHPGGDLYISFGAITELS